MNAHPQQNLAHAIRFLSIDAIVKALFKPGAKPRLSTVEKALLKRGLPFGYGNGVLFTTEAAWNAKLMGIESAKKDDDPIDFLGK